MNTATDVLSDVIVHSKYARWWGELGRRETYEEVVARNLGMVFDRVEQLGLHPDTVEVVKARAYSAYEFVHNKQVLPSMRSLQFAGDPILRDHNRIYNCGYMHVNRVEFFRELMFELLGGSGIGYSVQTHHIDALPPLSPGKHRRRYIVQDSVVGWADAVDAMVQHWLNGQPYPEYDFQDVRPEGSILKTSGGKAPGPEPLKRALHRIDKVFQWAYSLDNYLKPIQAHDIACHVADAVLSGGIRRSAMIALFSPDDRAMRRAKSGRWFDHNPQRANANNSAVLLRGEDEDLFNEIFRDLQDSGSGEPGFYWTNDRDMGTNPCAEIALNDRQFCNLTTIDVGTVESQEDLNARARAAATIGTLQATFTDFHYLSPEWKETTEREALVGVSMTGIASGIVQDLDLSEAAQAAKDENMKMANMLGINPAARVTTVKPEGTASLVLGTSSGIHAWHDKFYVRRILFNKSEAIAQYLMQALPYRPTHDPNNLYPVEDRVGNDQMIVLSIPQRAPDGAVTRDEGALSLLNRVADFNERWVRAGHRSGANSNNVSTTVNVRPDEWEDVRAWMFRNRRNYNGIAVLPHDGGTYVQAPFETIDEGQYNDLVWLFNDIDITQIDETADYTTLAGEAACAGGACEVVYG